MCGIVAILSKRHRVDAEALTRAAESLSHRGPDCRRIWLAPDREVGLGHARLAIIDLAGGDQPLSDEDGMIHAVVAGEFYGFEAIRRQLQARGHQFRTHSDSEILLHLYQEMGVDCFSELRGEFSFVLWDQAEHRLFAARDRFGIKPLFYAETDETLLIASEAKALFAAGIEPRWDREALLQQIFAFLPPDRSLFAGVHQLPAGHRLQADRRGLRIEPYWDLDYPREEEQALSGQEEDWVAELRSALDEAVGVRLVSDVPVGCFLSGGIDSSAVLGVAAQQTASPPRAFTISFDGSDYDESSIARETAALTGAPFHPIIVDLESLSSSFEDAVWHAEMLGVNPHGIARYLNALAVREAGYRVVLSGEGSDELLAGYGHIRQDLKRRGRDQVPAALESVRARLGFVPAWLQTLAISRAFFHLLLEDEVEEAVAKRDIYGEFLSAYDVDGQMAGRSPVLQSLYLWSKSILPNYILFAERLEMAHGVEVRLPFLDHHLFALVRRFPIGLLAGELREKHALREAVRPVVTETVYRRAKQPFTAPSSSWDRGSNRLFQSIQELLSEPVLADVPFFDPRKVRNLLASWPSLEDRQQVALDPLLVIIASTCVLQKRYSPGWA